MEESVVIVEIMNELYKFSTLEEVDKFCATFEKGLKVIIYLPTQIATMETK